MTVDMNTSQDRTILIGRLAQLEIPAFESEFGGGLKGIEVVLLRDGGGEALSVVANSIDHPCEIGLSGFRSAKGRMIDCGSDRSVSSQSLDAAVQTIRKYWDERDVLVGNLRAGAYDLQVQI